MTTNMIFDQLHNVIASQIPAVSDVTQLPTAGLAGRLYYSVADASMYVDTGSVWVLVATTASEVTAGSNFGGANQLIVSSGTAKAVQSSTVTADSSGNLTATITISPTVEGATTASGNLTLKSTAHATKGLIKLGTSAYDEVNQRLGIATQAPAYALDITAAATAINVLCDDNVMFIQSTSTHGGVIGFVARRGVDIRINNTGQDVFQFLDNSAGDFTAQLIGRQNKSLLFAADGSNAARGVITRMASGQTALLHDFQDSTSTTVASVDISGNVSAFKDMITAITPVSAANGATTTLDNTTQLLAVTPATGTVAGHTIKFPPSPVNGQKVTISNAHATSTITALTLDANGHTIVGGITALNTGTTASYRYITGTTTWIPAS